MCTERYLEILTQAMALLIIDVMNVKMVEGRFMVNTSRIHHHCQKRK